MTLHNDRYSAPEKTAAGALTPFLRNQSRVKIAWRRDTQNTIERSPDSLAWR